MRLGIQIRWSSLKRFLLFLLLCGAPFIAIGGDNPELRALKSADQADRQGVEDLESRDAVLDRMKRDKVRRDRVLEIVEAGGLSTAWDYFNAALVLQHGREIEDVRLAHALPIVSSTIDPSHSGAKWLRAASWDRLMMRLGRPQWYGTQSVLGRSGRWEIYQVEPGAVTDADRAALGVPSLADAEVKVAARNASR